MIHLHSGLGPVDFLSMEWSCDGLYTGKLTY